MPIIIKGVLTKEATQQAVAAGAKGVIVSNHGARQLDHVGGTIEALPEVVEGAAGRITVMMDGGIRRGTDVIKALALGAKAVLIGRPYAYGLSAFGGPGVERVLQILRSELVNNMGLCGVGGLKEIDKTLVRVRSQRMGEVFRLSISFLVVSVLAGLPCGAQTDSSPRIFRPTANSMVDPGPLSVVARGSAAASLMLDGTPIAVTRPGPQALTTTVTPSAGRHELVLRDGDAEERIAFFVGVFSSAAQPQEEWKAFRSHPPPATGTTCSACHAVRDGKWESAGGGIASNCFRCHNAELFPKVHTHERGVLADCTICHLAHGSTESQHLKMTPKAACTQCHF